MSRGLVSSIRDEPFFVLLTAVMARFMSLSATETALGMRAALVDLELRTIAALIAMDDFRTHQSKERLSLILQTIMHHFADDGVRQVLADVRSPGPGSTSLTIDALVSDAAPSKEPAQAQAGRLIIAFQALAKSQSQQNLMLFMEVFFDICSVARDEALESVNFAFSLLVRNIASQSLCVFLSEIFRQLDRAAEPHLSLLVDTLTELLLSNRGPLGYSALDIASNLLKLLRKQKPPAPDMTRVSFLHQPNKPPPKAVFTICNCLGTPFLIQTVS